MTFWCLNCSCTNQLDHIHDKFLFTVLLNSYKMRETYMKAASSIQHVSNTYHIYYVPTQCSSLLIFFSIQTTLPQGFLKRYQEHHFIKMLTLTNHIKWNRDQCSKLFHCTVLSILSCHLVVNKSTDNGKMYRYMICFLTTNLNQQVTEGVRECLCCMTAHISFVCPCSVNTCTLLIMARSQ